MVLALSSLTEGVLQGVSRSRLEALVASRSSVRDVRLHRDQSLHPCREIPIDHAKKKNK